MLGADVLKLGSDLDFTTPQKKHSPNLVTDEAMLHLMETVKKQIQLFEQTTVGYKALIASLMSKLKERKAAEGTAAAVSSQADLERLRGRVATLEDDNRRLSGDLRVTADAERSAKEQMIVVRVDLETFRSRCKMLEAERDAALADVLHLRSELQREQREVAQGKIQLQKVTQALLKSEAEADKAGEAQRSRQQQQEVETALARKLQQAEQDAKMWRQKAVDMEETQRRRSGEGAGVMGSPRQVATQDALKQRIVELETAQKKLISDLRAATQAEQKAQESKTAAEQRAEKLRQDMSLFIKGSRQQSTTDLEAAASATSVLSSSSSSDVEKLRQDLHAERQLSAQLRSELGQRTREALANKAEQVGQAGGPKKTGNSSQPVVLDGPAEWQRMNELELRARIATLADELRQSQQSQRERDVEMQRLVQEVTSLGRQVSGKEKTIADLTMKLTEQVATRGPDVNERLASELDVLEQKQNKMDADMELMEENLTLQAAVAEKDELIAQLKKEIQALKK